MSYQADENGRYRFPMLPDDRVRVIADCSCGWAMDGPERVFDWLDDRHAHAHNKGIDGLPAAGHMEVQRIAAERPGPEAGPCCEEAVPQACCEEPEAGP